MSTLRRVLHSASSPLLPEELLETLISFRFSHKVQTRACSSSAQNLDFLDQFSPSSSSNSININSYQRRKVIVGLGKIIKQGKGFLLKDFALGFCPYTLFNIMKHFGDRQLAFAFFKFAFRQDSITCCCTVIHLLAAERLRYLSQDVLSYIIFKIGPTWSLELFKLMWRDHRIYQSTFSLLDSLMRAYLELDMIFHVLRVLAIMRAEHLKPSLSAMNIFFKLLLKRGDYVTTWRLFKDMIAKGPYPCNYTFNTMVLGFCRRGNLQTGESLLHLMPKFCCEPDVYTYNIIINSYCILGRSLEAHRWIDFMISTGCFPTHVTFSTIINALCKEGNMVDARNLFDVISELGITPNTIIYNTLIDGYVKAREIGQATSLYEEMKEQGFTPDTVTFNILVYGHCKFGSEEDGDKLLRDLLVPDLFPAGFSVSDISVAGLCWAGRLDDAMTFLQDMLEEGAAPSVIAFNSIIAAYSKAGLEDKAFEAYRCMLEFGLTPSSSTCSSLLMGLCNIGMLREAWELMGKMLEKGDPVNRVAFTVILDGYFRMGHTTGARDLWYQMESRAVAPDAIAYSAFINGLAKAGLMEEAYAMYVEMLRKGFVPNNITYNSLISGFCRCGKLSKALELEKEMMQRGLLPDVFTRNIIINGFCKQREINLANDMFMDMHRIGLAPDIVTYNTLFSGYCKVMDLISAEVCVKKMYANGWEPDITTYNMWIHMFCSKHKIGRAVKLLDELVLLGIVPNTITYNTMMNGVCRDITYKLDLATIVIAKLLKMAFVPNVVTVNSLLSHFCKQGQPDKVLVWGNKLRQVSFPLDDVTHTILDRANCMMCKGTEKDADSSNEGLQKASFLDFLMYTTYDYICRNRNSNDMDLCSPIENSESIYGSRKVKLAG